MYRSAKQNLCYVTLLAVCLLCLLAGIAGAQTWDAASGWSHVSNPSGAWQYGWKEPDGTGFARYWSTPTNYIGLEQWNVDIWSPGGGNELGEAEYNPYSYDIYTNGDGQFYKANSVSVCPGAWGHYATFRWTSPYAGSLEVNALFTGQDYVGATTDVHVLLNGTSLFDGVINGFIGNRTFAAHGPSPTAQFDTIITVAAGDVIEFAVRNGGNGYESDNTGLVATLQAVPEPSSILVLLTGAAGLVTFARRRR